MPRIDSYDLIGSVADDDLLLISDTSANNTTNSVEISSLASHINIGKQNQLTLTTTGTSGPATLTGATLNIPQYSAAGTVTQITTTAPITGGTITTTGTIGITQASGSSDGYLSSADWSTFNNKSTFDGQYSSLTGAPTLATVATSGAYSDLSGTPTLATVATSGSYNDLSNKPTTGVTFDYTNSATNLVIGESLTYTTQQGNVGLGYGVLENQTGSSFNTAIGYESLQYSISGSGQNTALGYRALKGVTGVTDGYYNTAVGYNAGAKIESAFQNVFIGWGAGEEVTDGFLNTIIGDRAGRALTTHDSNVMIGQIAGALHTGNRNVFIGKSANNLTGQTGSNNIVIGFNAQQSATSVDNEITIGNTSINSLRIPGLQSGASNGDVLTYSSTSGNITLQTPVSQTKGTYTPQLVCSNSDLTVNSYASQVGRWVRVGNVVTCDFTIMVNLSDLTITNTASTANVKIQGTPYDATSSDLVTGYISYSRGWELSLSDVIVLTGSSYIGNLNFQPGLKNTSITNHYLPDDLRVKHFANVNSNFQIMGSYTYVTNTSTLNSGAAVT